MNQIEIPDCIALRITSQPMNNARCGIIPPELVAAIESAVPRSAVKYTSGKEGEAPVWLFAPGTGWMPKPEQYWTTTDVEHGEGQGLQVFFTRGAFAGEFAPFTWSQHWSVNPMTTPGLPMLNKADAVELLAKFAPMIDAKQTYAAPALPEPKKTRAELLAAGERFLFGDNLAADQLQDRGYTIAPVRTDGTSVEPERDPRGGSLGFREDVDSLALGIALAGLVAVQFKGEGAEEAAQAFSASIGTRYSAFGVCAALPAVHRKTGAQVLLFSRANGEPLVAKKDHSASSVNHYAARYSPDNFTIGAGSVQVQVQQVGAVKLNDYQWTEANPMRWGVDNIPSLGQHHVESVSEVVTAALAAQPVPPTSRKGKALPVAA